MARGASHATLTDLIAALRSVVTAFEAEGIEYALVGSVAAAAWGVARTTRDVDLVAVIDRAQLDRFLATIDRSELYVAGSAARDALDVGGSFNVIHTAGGGKVDIFVPPAGDPFTQSRIARRSRLDVLGVMAWVATPEDVVLAKLRWRLESRSEQQWRDCVEIVAVNDMDVPYLHSWAARLGISTDLAELLHGPVADGGPA